MAPNQGSQGMPRIGARVPSNVIEAAEILAAERYDRHDKWNRSRVVREALLQYLLSQEDLPEEGRDLLDEDLLANAGEGEEVEI